MPDSADVVVIGAGIAGVATAYELTVNRGVERVVVVDPRTPLTLTSDKSTECYRNWWPDKPMIQLMNRSIEALEGLAYLSGNAFSMNRRGYMFVTSDPVTQARMTTEAGRIGTLGGGEVRHHPGADPYGSDREGADVLDAETLGRTHPYLADDAIGAVHVRGAGWLDAQQLGAWMLDRARAAGAVLVRAEVGDITVGDVVTGVRLTNGESISAPKVVDAAGPMAAAVARFAGVELPLHSELHLKVVFKDHLGAVPRDAPMLIWCDPQLIDWTDVERAGLIAAGRQELLDELPVFCHGRPEGGPDSSYVVALWEYRRTLLEPIWPIPMDDLYPEVVIRGLSRMIPALEAYREGLPEASVDGGYYTKTRENRPLIGPCGPSGFFVIAGLSGFGIMIAAGASQVLADHMVGTAPSDLAGSFLLSRYQDKSYLSALDQLEGGQL